MPEGRSECENFPLQGEESVERPTVANCIVVSFNDYGFGYARIHDTEVDGRRFFTGSVYFQVKEIQIFEHSYLGKGTSRLDGFVLNLYTTFPLTADEL
jgi:hypothetical protein